MSDIQFRIAAKTDVGLERSNNEDNFQVSANLEEAPMKWVNNQQRFGIHMIQTVRGVGYVIKDE